VVQPPRMTKGRPPAPGKRPHAEVDSLPATADVTGLQAVPSRVIITAARPAVPQREVTR
jgi:hypothetical protein